MSTALTTNAPDATLAEAMEKVIAEGDLAGLSSEQRMAYYNRICESVGLNPYTRPFEYVKLQGKLTLYARKDATEQLRKLNGVSITRIEKTVEDGIVVVMAYAQDKTGRADVDMGAVSVQGLAGEGKANAVLKAITKAKRRVTLSICGLGWLDESEVDSIPGAVVGEPSVHIVETSNGKHANAITGEIVGTPSDPYWELRREVLVLVESNDAAKKALAARGVADPSTWTLDDMMKLKKRLLPEAAPLTAAQEIELAVEMATTEEALAALTPRIAALADEAEQKRLVAIQDAKWNRLAALVAAM